MNQLNSIILEGNLVRDVVLSEPCKGFNKASFTIGVNRWYKNMNGEGCTEVSYFDVEGYGPIAQYAEKKATKGRGIRVVGRLKQDTWKDEDGKFHSKTFVVAEHIEYRPLPFSSSDANVTQENGKNNNSAGDSKGSSVGGHAGIESSMGTDKAPVTGVEHIKDIYSRNNEKMQAETAQTTGVQAEVTQTATIPAEAVAF